MSYRILNQAPVYFDNEGNLCAGGSLEFYENETDTPKDVYGAPDLTPNLGSVVTLDSSGRTETDVWGDGTYTVVLKTAADVEVWSRDNVRDYDASSQVVIPDPASGSDGQVVTTDGVDYYLATPLYVPDPTGNAGEQLGTDGSLVFWEAKPTIPTLPTDGITQNSTSFTIGKLKAQFGTGTAPSAAAQTTSVTVTFATAYTTLLYVGITPTVGAVTGEGGGVEVSAVSATTTGFTATFIAPDMGSIPGSENITSNVTFQYCAFGIIA